MRLGIILSVLLLCSSVAGAQGVLSDILSGALINPEVGVYAWYSLKDTATNTQLFMRQAIVGKKQVAGKTGYYLETEIIPEIGFPIIYKMLLTGPASTPGNVHEIMVKDGNSPPESLPVDLLKDEAKPEEQGARESLGKEKIAVETGDVEAEHFQIKENGQVTEVWINDAIRPMGIVKMVSPEGELLLTRHGVGGKDAESALNRDDKNQGGSEVKVQVNAGPNKNFSAKGAAE